MYLVNLYRYFIYFPLPYSLEIEILNHTKLFLCIIRKTIIFNKFI